MHEEIEIKLQKQQEEFVNHTGQIGFGKITFLKVNLTVTN
jgi:hypothetical protein